MPELPEVETFKRFIDKHVLRKPIRAVQVFRDKILSGISPKELEQTVRNHQFTQTLRQGKALFVALGENTAKLNAPPSAWLLFHFGMTGYLSYAEQGRTIVNAYNDPSRPDAHVRVQFNFDDGSHLAFHEQRMFGYMALLTDPWAYIAEKKLGPDALVIDKPAFLERLNSRKAQIKPILMDQSFVAGIGNVYADEMLFQCGIHPETLSAQLSERDRACLFQQMHDVLESTVACRADRQRLPEHYLLHTRRAKGRCPRDGAVLESKPVGGRTTYYCPVCQNITLPR